MSEFPEVRCDQCKEAFDAAVALRRIVRSHDGWESCKGFYCSGNCCDAAEKAEGNSSK